MAENTNKNVNITSLIMIPSVISLAITILRLVGELQNWSPVFFNRKAGGGGAIVGIAWLAPIFGIYFAVKLRKAGSGSVNASKGILMAIIGIVIVVGSAFAAAKILGQENPGVLAVFAIAFIVAAWIQKSTWPELFKTLFCYGLAARIPVAIVMLIAIQGNWGTHYDVAPNESFPAMSWFMKWVLIGAVPQFLIWIPFTILSGALFGSITAAITGKKSETTPATA